MKLYLLSAIAIIASASVSAQNYDTVKIILVKVQDNVYMLKGAGGNVGLLIGKEGTLMIDDQFAPLSNKINGAIKSLDPGEIRFLINTHLHGDHTGGNENFRRIGATVVAHNQVRNRMSKEQVNKTFNRTTPARVPEALPVITFADKLNFHLNDEDIELIHLDNGHTDGDVLIHFIKANVYHTGDAFVRYGYPFIDVSSGGTFTGFLNSLDKILAITDENSKIIPGHGELATKADVKSLRDKLVDIKDQVLVALKKGKKVEDITSLGITDKYDEDLGNGFFKGKDFVLLVATELIPTLPVKK